MQFTGQHRVELAGDQSHGFLLLHGFTSGPHSMKEIAQKINAHGFPVTVPLLAGHGTVVEDLNKTRFQRWQQQVRDEFASLSAHVEKITVMGLSMGGTLALDAACELDSEPRLAQTIVINPALGFKNPAAHFAGLLKHVVPYTSPIANDMARTNQDEHAYGKTPTAGVEQLAGLIRTVRSKLAHRPPEQKPVHLMLSAVDNVVPRTSAKLLRKRLGSNFTETILPNSRHVATMDLDLDQIVEKSIHAARGEL